MQYVNVTTIVSLLAVALIVFVVLRNRRDRRKLLKEDLVEDEIAKQQRRKGKL